MMAHMSLHVNIPDSKSKTSKYENFKQEVHLL